MCREQERRKSRDGRGVGNQQNAKMPRYPSKPS